MPCCTAHGIPRPPHALSSSHARAQCPLSPQLSSGVGSSRRPICDAGPEALYLGLPIAFMLRESGLAARTWTLLITPGTLPHPGRRTPVPARLQCSVLLKARRSLAVRNPMCTPARPPTQRRPGLCPGSGRIGAASTSPRAPSDLFLSLREVRVRVHSCTLQLCAGAVVYALAPYRTADIWRPSERPQRKTRRSRGGLEARPIPRAMLSCHIGV